MSINAVVQERSYIRTCMQTKASTYSKVSICCMVTFSTHWFLKSRLYAISKLFNVKSHFGPKILYIKSILYIKLRLYWTQILGRAKILKLCFLNAFEVAISSSFNLFNACGLLWWNFSPMQQKWKIIFSLYFNGYQINCYLMLCIPFLGSILFIYLMNTRLPQIPPEWIIFSLTLFDPLPTNLAKY